MNKYRKKPIVIEAMQLTRKYFDEIFEWIGEENIEDSGSGEFYEDTCYIQIKTLEGNMEASEGDFIIKGIENEFYACKERIFNKTYEKVEE